MKLKNQYTLTGLAGEFVAVPLDGGDGFHGLVKLNESGAEVFRGLIEGETESQLEERLMKRYPGLDVATARKAVSLTLDRLKGEGLIEA